MKLLPILFLILLTGCATRGFSPSTVNLDKVDAFLYRGGQPNNLGIQQLKQLGIKTVINLRMPYDVLQEEANECLVNDITYTNIPLNGTHAPTDEQVGHILKVIETSPAPVFIHCQHGCDRTGTIIACYRIKYGYTNKQALLEAEQYGLSELEWGMRNYIKNFKAATPTLTYIKWIGKIDSSTLVACAILKDGKVIDGFGENYPWVKNYSSDWFFSTDNWKNITKEEYNIEKNKFKTKGAK